MSLDIFCQCCLNKGDDQVNMSSPVNNQGILELYEEMLQYSTGIQLQQDDNIHYICTICICKLRESCKFKSQVEATQRKLTIAFHNCYIKTEYDIDEDITKFKPFTEVPITFDNNEHPLKSCAKNKEQENDDSDNDLNNELHLIFGQPKPASKSCESSSSTIDDTKSFSEKTTIDKTFESSSESESESNTDFESYFTRGYKSKRNEIRKKASLLKCKKCTAGFNNKEEYELHTTSCAITRICPHCGKTFENSHLYDGHMLTHTAKVECKICKKLVTKSNLSNHVRLHNGELIYRCYKCPEKFKYFHLRRKHMVEVHGDKPWEYPCKICTRVFKNASLRSNHVHKDHLMDAKYSCSECNKKFFVKNDLSKHMLVHTGEKNFECDVCHKRYARRTTLKEHLKIHNNIKDFHCHICGIAFTQKCTLNGHLKTHNK